MGFVEVGLWAVGRQREVKVETQTEHRLLQSLWGDLECYLLKFLGAVDDILLVKFAEADDEEVVLFNGCYLVVVV